MRSMRRQILLIALMTFSLSAQVSGWYPRDDSERTLEGKGPAPVIDSNRTYYVGDGDTLIQLTRAFGLGFQNVARANPGVDPWIPRPGTAIVLPYATVLPRALKPGITINLGDFKLYLLELYEGIPSVRIYPVGIGVDGWETPLGEFAVLNKAVRPTWSVPEAIRAEDPSLPRFVPPGPDNPLGDYWLAFSQERHGIHGTNEPYGVGRRVSHGCIRLYPEDIKDLFGRVNRGTPVNVIYEPVKLGMRNGKVLLEVHDDYLGTAPSIDDLIRERCDEIGCYDNMNRAQIHIAETQRLGYPVSISAPADRLALQTEP